MSIAASGEPGRVRGSARLLRLASDDRLVTLLRQGSDPAFEVLFARHHRPLLAFCRHMLGSAEDAEDAVQHTFLAAYRDLLASEREIRLRPWLYAIARNRCLSVLRTRQAQPHGDREEEPSTEHLSAAVERRHDLRSLLGDLAALPDDQRAALVLTELGEVSHHEIALVLGCRREKVKALVFQARKTLIANRVSRETPCAEIRTQLSNLRGNALRRGTLRRHLRVCAGCREFRDEVAAQRRALAVILPVAPTAGLKAAVLGGGPAAGAAATAALAGGASGSLATKALVAVALAGGGTAAVESTRDQERRSPPAAVAPARAVPAAAEAPRPVAAEAPRPVAARPREQSLEARPRSDARRRAEARPERPGAVPGERFAKSEAPPAHASKPAGSRGVGPEKPIARPVMPPQAKNEPNGAAKGRVPKATRLAPAQVRPVPPALGREERAERAPGRPESAGPPEDRGGAPARADRDGEPAHADRGAG
jgi:RNA polymerase sigma factor (sigma-70 family)